MSCEIINQTGEDQDALSGVITDFYPYAQEKLGFMGPVSVKLISDKENSADVLGKTAFYDPLEKIISLFTDNRHPKDILRSFSHELVHHAQNERGEFDNLDEIGEGYAQKNEHLREMESEAYLEGNLNLRDFEDGLKAKRNENMKKLNENALKELVIETLAELFKEQGNLGALDTNLDDMEADEPTNVEKARMGMEPLEEDEELEETSIPDVVKPVNVKPATDKKETDVLNAPLEPEEEDPLEPAQESVSNERWYSNALFETLRKKWTK